MAPNDSDEPTTADDVAITLSGQRSGHGMGIAEDLAPDQDGQQWANTAVRLRVPSGTDPLAALREAMGVFMERRDGTNAMPWWQRVRWWHGGPAGLKQGDVLLPPSETGIMPALVGTDKASVYLTLRQEVAIMYAAPFESPALYEVLVDDEPVRDDVLPDDPNSWRVRSARVWRKYNISSRQAGLARTALSYGLPLEPAATHRPADQPKEGAS